MKDLIYELPNFLPGEFCDHLINKYEDCKDKHTPGIIFINGKEYIDKNYKNSMEMSPSKERGWDQETTLVRKYIARFVKKYKNWMYETFKRKGQELHMLDAIMKNPTGERGYTIQKQQKGAKYAWHYDGSISEGIDFGLIIIYLNTVEQGGETEFINGRKVKPERGKAIIFPANWTYPHCGNEVISGDKYILTSMIYYA